MLRLYDLTSSNLDLTITSILLIIVILVIIVRWRISDTVSVYNKTICCHPSPESANILLNLHSKQGSLKDYMR